MQSSLPVPGAGFRAESSWISGSRRRCFALCLRRGFLSRSIIWTALRTPWRLSESDGYPIPERDFSFQCGRASMAGPAKQSQAVHCRSAQNTDAGTTTTYVKFILCLKNSVLMRVSMTQCIRHCKVAKDVCRDPGGADKPDISVKRVTVEPLLEAQDGEILRLPWSLKSICLA